VNNREGRNVGQEKVIRIVKVPFWEYYSASGLSQNGTLFTAADWTSNGPQDSCDRASLPNCVSAGPSFTMLSSGRNAALMDK
jgi:hypothetical protein